jgi:dipeptidase
LIAFLLLSFGGVSYSAETKSYAEGFSFGQSHHAAIEGNINAMLERARDKHVDMQPVIKSALESEALYKEILPEKVDWLKGVAAGSGVAYQNLLVFNANNRMATGFSGECTTFMAQGKALASGKGTIITKNRDLGTKTLSEVDCREAATHPRGAVYKAAYINIPEQEKTCKFIGSRSAGRWGYGMGVNEYQVIVSDNDAPSRDTLAFEKGLHDNDLVRLVLERAKTARQGVDVIAALVPEFGQAWNGIMFEIGDPNELWVVAITGPRWVAKRYTDTVTARSNQYEIGDDYDLASPDLVSFAVEQGWAPAGTKRINFTKVYSTDELYPEDNDLQKRHNAENMYNTEIRYQRAMELLKGKEGKLEPEDFMAFARDHFDTYTLPGGKVIDMHQTPFYSSGQMEWKEWLTSEPESATTDKNMFIRAVCHHGVEDATAASAVMVARPGVPNELGYMLNAFMQPCNSVYVPFYVGVTDVDNRFKGPEAAAAFQNIAARAFTRYTDYHAAIRQAFDPFEASLFKDMAQAEAVFMKTAKDGKHDEAVAGLTDFVRNKSIQAFNLAGVAQDNMTKAAVDSSSW